MPAQQPDGEHADVPGLEPAEAARLLRVHGPNALPQPRQPSLAAVFMRQFLSPLIYVLLAAALVSVALGDVRDAAFIGVVLLVNGVIGTVQEYSAGRATAALRRLEQPRATVVRTGERYEIDARELVPGDVVMIEAGGRVPADLRLLESQDLQCDESLLTGEALPVAKAVSEAPAPAYAGTLVTRGRATGLVTATGRETEIGRIAGLLAGPSDSPPPLMIRLEAFSRAVAVSVGIAVVVLMLVGLARNMGFHELFLMAVGLAGMQDPLRPEVPKAISACRQAGIEIVMVTGDDPRTASAIARQAGIDFTEAQVVTGEQVTEAEAAGEAALDALTRSARIYARVKPVQKLAIVRSLQRNGHFVAVTGDGVNDAPALKHAHVGVAMGRKGTDVAKESADIIVTDDNFASIVAGIRAGRVAYANIRKVVFMLVSTGAAEVLLFLLALPFGLPMPLLPVQLLWLNLVTNGIQDVFLAGERPEGDELSYPPRNPREPIFDRPMLRRILISTLVMGGGAFALFWWLLERGHSEFEARNLLLLLFVLFENLQTLNSRSEHHSAFRQGFFGNPLLIIGIVGAQAVHVLAMHIPLLRETLSLAPVTWREWAMLLAAGTVLLAAMELDKWRARRAAAAGSGN